jgi:heme/copper-type cytochrome/quinol oxidase subunit 2
MRMSWKEAFYVTINASLLAIMYTVFGALISYIFYHIFDEFNDEWKKRSEAYKITEVTVELIIIANIAFWSAQYIEMLQPFVPVRKELDRLVDGFISGIFFIFAIFLFIDQLTEKLKYLYHDYLEEHAGRIFPQYGSIIDLSLSYTPKTERT